MKREQIENAVKGITIQVPKGISYRTKNPNNCAMAKACRLLDNVEDAAIYTSTAYVKFKDNDKWQRYRVPSGARKEIIRFDRTASFRPGEYRLVPIQPSHRATGARIGGVGGRPTGKSKRQKPVFLKGVRAKAQISAL